MPGGGQKPDRIQSLLSQIHERDWTRLTLLRRIPAAEALDRDELAQLTGDAPAHCRECHHDLLARQAVHAVDGPALRQLAAGYRHLGYLGEWEQTLLRVLAEADDPALSRELWLELAAHHLDAGHLRRVEDVVERLLALETPPADLARYRDALGPERYARAEARARR